MSINQSQSTPNKLISDFLIPSMSEIIEYLISESADEDSELGAKTPFDLILIGETQGTTELRNKLLEVWQQKHLSLDLGLMTEPEPNHEPSLIIDKTEKQATDNLFFMKNSKIQKLKVDTYSIAEFLQLTFHKRYDLGVFIHPVIFQPERLAATDFTHNHVETNHADIKAHADLPPTTDSYHTTDLYYGEEEQNLPTQAQLRSIAIRLRDLFTRQSLIYLPSSPSLHLASDNDSTDDFQNNSLSFNDLGYIPLKLSNYNLEMPAQQTLSIITCWQFNLYDYKPRPDWLNAKYWANPENFNKFRW